MNYFECQSTYRLILLLLLLCIESKCERPQPTSVRNLPKSGGYLQSDLFFYDISVEFDQELFLLEAGNTCGYALNECVPPPNTGCGECNYASKTNCGEREFGQNQDCPICENKDLLCGNDTTWLEIVIPSDFGVGDKVELEYEQVIEGNEINIRVFIPSNMRCNALKFIMSPYYGDPDFEVEGDNNYNSYGHNGDGNGLIYCPSMTTSNKTQSELNFKMTAFGTDSAFKFQLFNLGPMEVLPSNRITDFYTNLQSTICSSENETYCAVHNIITDNIMKYTAIRDDTIYYVYYLDPSLSIQNQQQQQSDINQNNDETCYAITITVWGDMDVVINFNDVYPNPPYEISDTIYLYGTWAGGFGELSFSRCFSSEEIEKGKNLINGNNNGGDNGFISILLRIYPYSNPFVSSYISVTSILEHQVLTSVPSLIPFDASKRISGNTRVECYKTNENGEQELKYDLKSYGREVSPRSIFLNEITSYNDSFVWPPFLWYISYIPETIYSLKINTSEEVITNNRVNFQILKNVVTRFDLNPEYYIYDDIVIDSQCNFTFLSRFVNSYYEPTYIPKEKSNLIEIIPENYVCDSTKLQNLVSIIDNLFVLLDDSIRVKSLLDTRFKIDRYTLSDTWQICQRELENIIQIQDQYSEQYSQSCYLSNSTFSDPCCYYQMNWEDCCTDRPVTYKTQIYNPSNENFRNKVCSKTDDSNQNCALTFLEDYNTYLSLEYSKSPGQCLSQVEQESKFQWDYMRPWIDCQSEIFGESLKGFRCTVDEQCSEMNKIYVGSNNQWICDTYQSKCVHPNIDHLFLECILENMHPFIWFKISSEISELSGALNFEKLHTYYSKDHMDCFIESSSSSSSSSESDQSIWDDKSHSRFIFDYSTNCFDSYYLCRNPFSLFIYSDLDISCSFSYCPRAWVNQVSSKEECEQSNYFCNWNSKTINSESQCLNQRSQYFCAFCPPYSDRCFEIPEITTEEGCNQVCFLPNGNYVIGISEGECQSLSSCSEKCLGTTIGTTKPCTYDQCLTYGYCTDKQYYNSTSIFYPFKYGCESESVEWYGLFDDIGDPCGVGYNYSVSAGKCFSSESAYTCQNSIPIALDEETCLTQQGCLRELYYPNKDSSRDLLPIHEKCSSGLCGKSVPLFKWTPALWKSGEIKKLKWIKREWKSQSVYKNGLDYARLGRDIESAIESLYAYQLKTEVRCRIGRLKGVIGTLYCLCDQEVGCSNGTFPSALGSVCSGTQTLLKAEKNELIFNKESVSSRVCIEVEVFLVSIELWRRGEQQKRFSSTFINYQTSVKDYEILNQNKAVVGRVIGDGIRVNSKLGIHNGTICFFINNYSMYGYDTFDIALFRFNDVFSIEILDISMTEKDETTICGEIEFSLLDKVREESEQEERSSDFGKSSLSFIPIVRIFDYENKENDDDKLSVSEKAIIIVVAIFYLFVVFYSFYITIMIRPWAGEVFSFANANAFLTFLLFVFGATRFTYLILLATDTLTTDSNITEILLMEAGTFIFLTVFLFILIFWIYLIKMTSATSNQENSLNQFKKVYFSVVILIWIIFLSLVISFLSVDGNQNPQTSCFDRLVKDDDGWTDQDSVILGYRILLVIIGVILAIGFAVYGSKVYKLKKSTNKSSSPNQNQENRIFYITTTSTLGFLAQSILLLILTLVNSSSNKSLIALIFLVPCEVFPAIFTCLTLSPTKSEKEKKKSSGGSGGTGSNYANTQSRFASSSAGHSSVVY